jgi:hypothetical protein
VLVCWSSDPSRQSSNLAKCNNFSIEKLLELEEDRFYADTLCSKHAYLFKRNDRNWTTNLPNLWVALSSNWEIKDKDWLTDWTWKRVNHKIVELKYLENFVFFVWSCNPVLYFYWSVVICLVIVYTGFGVSLVWIKMYNFAWWWLKAGVEI